MSHFSYSIGSNDQREDLYAEIYWNNVQWAELFLSVPDKNVQIKLYESLTQDPYTFDLNDFIDVINEAKNKLLSVEGLI